ncbi:MAG: ATP-dependent sacrificial sulfur transferase LarE [Lachnospiraceae bacterium]|nr:ATP-dependent sacrificial sulfur transferase LarE [Lachnospiraceae bacterium]
MDKTESCGAGSTFSDKAEQLEEMIHEAVRKGVCIAFSGGVDSSLLLAVACREQKRSGGTVFGVMFDTFLHTKGDEEAARQVSMECGADFAVLPVNELDNTAILNNPQDRCYQCKKYLFTRLKEFAKKHQCAVVMDGTNADDLKAYRPGLTALKELGILSPLKEAGFTKEDVRRMAAEYGISAAGKPSNSCLATRLPYGERLDAAVLERIAAGEDYLSGLGFSTVRIRLHGQVARIELEPEQFSLFLNLREDIAARLKELGFIYITLDAEGFRSGSMDL